LHRDDLISRSHQLGDTATDWLVTGQLGDSPIVNSKAREKALATKRLIYRPVSRLPRTSPSNVYSVDVLELRSRSKDGYQTNRLPSRRGTNVDWRLSICAADAGYRPKIELTKAFWLNTCFGAR